LAKNQKKIPSLIFVTHVDISVDIRANVFVNKLDLRKDMGGGKTSDIFPLNPFK